MAADSNQKKRTSEALERRFALAKAEHLQLQQKNLKRALKEGEEQNLNSHSITSLVRTSSSIPGPKKGHFTFSGHTPSRGASGISDEEANGPAYSPICQPLHENLLTSGGQLSSRRDSIVNKVLHQLLHNGDSAQKYMQGSRSMKIDNWLLLDNFVQGRGVASVGARNRALQSHSKRSKRHMSMKQHKKCGSFDFPQELQKFDIFKPMHKMWKDYIMQLLKKVGKSQLAQCLLTADLHGAIIQVVECKVISFTGVSGIMVRETAETFGIITEANKFRGKVRLANLNLTLPNSIKFIKKGLLLLYRKGLLYLYFRLIAGKSHCTGTNSPQEIRAHDFDLDHCISGLLREGSWKENKHSNQS